MSLRVVARCNGILSLWATLSCLLTASPLFAHAVLVTSSPEPNQQLETSPAEIELRFSENVAPMFFRVLDRTGRDTGRTGEIRLDGKSIYLPVEAALPPGTYVVTYRVVSEDTHAIGGSFIFALGAVQDGTVSIARDPGSLWVFPTAINRMLLYSSVLLAVGSALLLVLLTWPRTIELAIRRQGRMAAFLAPIAFILAIGLGGADMVAGSIDALFGPESWSAGARSTLGWSALFGIAGSLLAIHAFAGGRMAALWVGGTLMIISFLVTGHAATASPVSLMVLSVAIHLAGAGFWFAAFLPLIRATRELSAPEAGKLLHQFSLRALWLIALLLLTGVVQTIVQVQTREGLTDTSYGTRLIFKILAVIALLGIAALNKWRLTPALRSAIPSSPERMRRSIRVEATLMLFIVAAAASLTATPPPRAIAISASSMPSAVAATGNHFKTRWAQGAYVAEIEFSPAHAGSYLLTVQFKDGSGQVVQMRQATLAVSLPEASIEPITKVGEAMANGMYHFQISELIVPGKWEFSVSGFVNDFDKVVFSGTILIL